jgi:N-acetylmuramoyl-L-alanine amidase CwlA
MERLAAKVEQTKFINPDTALTITRFVDQNGYDCDNVVCTTQLQARNRAVRDRLKTLIAHKTPFKPTLPASESETTLSLVPASAPPAIMGTEPK